MKQEVSIMEQPPKYPIRLFWVVIAISIVGTGGALLLITHQTAAPKVTSVTPSIVVAITDSGFVPASVVVKSGAIITWHNQTASPRQIGANPFPSHSDLPGLFSNSAIGPDGTYSYTFTKTGTWGYSDYAKPTEGGIVIVR